MTVSAALGVLLPCLLLVLPAAAFPRQGSAGERVSPPEPALGAEEGKSHNASSQGSASPSSAARPRLAAAPGLLAEPDPGAKCLPGVAGAGPGPSPFPWPLGGLEGPVCSVRVERDGLTPGHLEVVGVLTRYESNFIKVLRQRGGWDERDLETFGLCPAAGAGAAPHPLRRIQAHLLEPGPERFLVLHLEEGRCEPPRRGCAGASAGLGEAVPSLRGWAPLQVNEAMR